MDTIGRITQLTNVSNDGLDNLKREFAKFNNTPSSNKITVLSDYEFSKSELISRLKVYQYDYEVTEGDDAMQKVIDWFINVTPDYIEEI